MSEENSAVCAHLMLSIRSSVVASLDDSISCLLRMEPQWTPRGPMHMEGHTVVLSAGGSKLHYFTPSPTGEPLLPYILTSICRFPDDICPECGDIGLHFMQMENWLLFQVSRIVLSSPHRGSPYLELRSQGIECLLHYQAPMMCCTNKHACKNNHKFKTTK